jgi:hypothetical protein
MANAVGTMVGLMTADNQPNRPVETPLQRAIALLESDAHFSDDIFVEICEFFRINLDIADAFSSMPRKNMRMILLRKHLPDLLPDPNIDPSLL